MSQYFSMILFPDETMEIFLWMVKKQTSIWINNYNKNASANSWGAFIRKTSPLEKNELGSLIMPFLMSNSISNV